MPCVKVKEQETVSDEARGDQWGVRSIDSYCLLQLRIKLITYNSYIASSQDA